MTPIFNLVDVAEGVLLGIGDGDNVNNGVPVGATVGCGTIVAMGSGVGVGVGSIGCEVAIGEIVVPEFGTLLHAEASKVSSNSLSFISYSFYNKIKCFGYHH